MSTGMRMPWADAAALAKRLSDDLAPVVERSKVVGSVRRRKPTVGDIEFLIEPRHVTADLFGATKPDTDAIHAVARTWGEIVKGGERMVQVTGVGEAGATVDLYLVHPPANWWCLMAIRTGPARLGHMAMVRMRDRGFRHESGRILRRDGSEHPVESEADFFACAGLRCLPPHERTPEAAIGGGA
ncbi:MAG TPA: hypothetical protein VK966_00955 [Longimicrobiales bacterium]|nr:hypothetical protein [Longimicrobiales bacterium]